MLKVHGVHGSPFVRKVLITLELKGLEQKWSRKCPLSVTRTIKAQSVGKDLDARGRRSDSWRFQGDLPLP